MPRQILSQRMGHLDERTTDLYIDKTPLPLAKIAGDVIDQSLLAEPTRRGRRGPGVSLLLRLGAKAHSLGTNSWRCCRSPPGPPTVLEFRGRSQGG